MISLQSDIVGRVKRLGLKPTEKTALLPLQEALSNALHAIDGASRDGRPELATILEFLRPGDELVVTRLDRLGRDTRDVLNVVHEAEQRGASITVLDPHVSTRGEMGHVLLTMLGMVAQMERRFIKERQREGIARAKADGVYAGGKRRLNREQVRALHAAGTGPAAIAAALGCSRMQVYRILQEQ